MTCKVRRSTRLLRTAPTDYYTAALATQGSCRRSSRVKRRVAASAWKPRCCAACWRCSRCGHRLSDQADPDPRQPDVSPLPGRRRRLVLPGRRQPDVLGEALQGARARAPVGRSALRLVAGAPREQPGAATVIDAKFKSQPRDYWLELLATHDIPAAPVQTVMEFMRHPSVQHHTWSTSTTIRKSGAAPDGAAIAFRGTPTRDPGPPPTLGQHTDAVLREIATPTTTSPGSSRAASVGEDNPGAGDNRPMAYEAIRYELTDASRRSRSTGPTSTTR